MTCRAASATKIAPRTGHATGFAGSSIAFPEGLYGNPAHVRRGTSRALGRPVQRWHDITNLASNARFNHAASSAFRKAVGFEGPPRAPYVRMVIPEVAV